MAAHPLLTHIRLDSHSKYALHRAHLPTRDWSPTGGTHGFGSFLAWDSSTADAQDMVEALVDAMLPHFRDHVIFDQWAVWQWDAGAGTWFPRAANALTGKIGTDSTTAWDEAVEAIFTFYDTDFNTAKLIQLDYDSRNNFARRSAATADADEQTLAGTLMADNWAWSSRAQKQLHALRSISLGINDELKKQYPGI